MMRKPYVHSDRVFAALAAARSPQTGRNLMDATGLNNGEVGASLSDLARRGRAYKAFEGWLPIETLNDQGATP